MSDKVIVVGVDGSDSSVDALKWAAGQAKLIGASLRVVSVWHYPVSLGWAPAWPDDWDPGAEAKKALAAVVERELGADPGVSVEQEVLEGHPAEVLVAFTEQNRIELLVLGSRGHGAFTGMLIGSTSEFSASHAHCPVVIVRHQDQDKSA
jgi:nucleotide-binding universal stress UspA family protein